MSKFIEALKAASEEIETNIKRSSLFTHSGEIGEFREEIIKNVLRPFLPECYGLGTGQVFSLDDEVSKQIDIIIYDAVYSNVLFKNNSSSLFPCESVYGEIEVKSNLSSDEFNKSIENIKSLKMLRREKSTVADITPMYRLEFGEMFTWDDNKRNNYLGIIFGFDGASYETLGGILEQRISSEDKDYLPDFIFNYKKNYMLVKLDDSKNLAGINSEFNCYGIIETENVIPAMFLVLNTVLNQIRLKSPDYNQYLINVLKKI